MQNNTHTTWNWKATLRRRELIQGSLLEQGQASVRGGNEHRGHANSTVHTTFERGSKDTGFSDCRPSANQTFSG